HAEVACCRNQQRSSEEEIAAESNVELREEGLVYTTDTEPGIRRVRRGRGFEYRDPAGETITDEQTLARIASLAIPPAWTDVWISARPRGHVQATGRDAKLRK